MKEHAQKLDLMRSDLTNGAVWWAVKQDGKYVVERWELSENSIIQLENMRASHLAVLGAPTGDNDE